jgi:hypothetical protein
MPMKKLRVPRKIGTQREMVCEPIGLSAYGARVDVETTVG